MQQPVTYNTSSVASAKRAKSSEGHFSTLTAAHQRLNFKENKKEFRVDGPTLFCRSCDVPIDHTRQSSLSQHLDSERSLKDFWTANNDVLPTLSKIAGKHAFLYSISAEVEKSFSAYKRILSEDRSRLKYTTLEMLNFLYSNLNRKGF